MKGISFEWDDNKAAINEAKHHITFSEANTVFADENAILFDDPNHSQEEERFMMLFVLSPPERQPRMKQLNTTKLTKGGKSMEKEYDIEKLNPRKNPYAKRVKKQITINIDGDTIDFFKAKSEKCGIPYQTLINLYLSDCKEQNRELELKWN